MEKKDVTLKALFGIGVIVFLFTLYLAIDDLKEDKLNFFTKIIYWEFFLLCLFFYKIRKISNIRIIKTNLILLILFLLESVLVNERYAEFLLRGLFVAIIAGGIKWYVDEKSVTSIKKKN